MTNKDSIQQKHLEEIDKFGSSKDYYTIGWDEISELCTTVTADAIKYYEEWKRLNGYYCTNDIWFFPDGDCVAYNDEELIQLFLNQKAKI